LGPILQEEYMQSAGLAVAATPVTDSIKAEVSIYLYPITVLTPKSLCIFLTDVALAWLFFLVNTCAKKISLSLWNICRWHHFSSSSVSSLTPCPIFTLLQNQWGFHLYNYLSCLFLVAPLSSRSCSVLPCDQPCTNIVSAQKMALLWSWHTATRAQSLWNVFVKARGSTLPASRAILKPHVAQWLNTLLVQAKCWAAVLYHISVSVISVLCRFFLYIIWCPNCSSAWSWW
jgi:hypothetical protein